jgi:uroporphyrinogen decarboxylase
MKLTLKERVLSSFRFEEVRPVPYTIWYDEISYKKLNQYYGNSEWKNVIKNHIDRIAIDWEPKRYIDENHYYDIHGAIWRDGNPRHLEKPAITEPDPKKLNIPSYVKYFGRSKINKSTESLKDGRTHLNFEEASQEMEVIKNKVFIVAEYGSGLFESSWMLRGYQDFFTDLILEPRFVNSMLDLLTTRQLEIIDKIAELPCDGILIIDDYGDQKGVNIGPERWRTFFKKRLGKLYERIHYHGKMTLHHSCGNIYDIIPDLIDIGLDVLQSLQPEAMPVYKIKKNYGKHLRLWGGFGTQQALPFGKPDEIRREVRHMKNELGKNGGYIFSSSKPILEEVPIENAIAFIEETIRSE